MKEIIIIEDDPFSQDFYKFIFTKAGLESTIIEDGDKLFERLNDGNVGVILMDLSLRNTYLKGIKTDGVELASKIKKSELYSSIPLIIVSAHSNLNYEVKVLKETQADDYITKPILDFNQFVKKIKNYILN
ncbi:MAG: hypothetical protein C0425_01995 [Chlorobiaceae bacterium]|nr:hypothetical protein [Chlorobiaceae bacterium]MBA4309090.1 hypothetical protein [Chlorobiaceae bacterium]